MKTKKMPPIHPGEILLEDFLEPMGISQYKLAKNISVPPRRINEIVQGKRSITADTALRPSTLIYQGEYLIYIDTEGTVNSSSQICTRENWSQ